MIMQEGEKITKQCSLLDKKLALARSMSSSSHSNGGEDNTWEQIQGGKESEIKVVARVHGSCLVSNLL